MSAVTKFLVDESERGPAIPEARLDTGLYVDLAVAVMQRALEDLNTRAFRNSARRFLLRDFGDTLWAGFCTINQEKLLALVRERCRQRPLVTGTNGRDERRAH